ncbi:T-lymphoma invasion and metastasis-inducing protein 1 [Bagarius yarrelli]|uniref:T-lymphoma invasion and metastasis-inducing protein 1 n=1 Tax=Bagarius yarrelli TaxID=175774 RepID=A0A556TTV7_BAGYA|nr:T-lymphoma invasion and metastasis-inducing protein 1 [Bagarius yarrelli]
MGNVESQYGSHSFYSDRERQLSRKRVSRSLRLSGKQSYRRKPEHRNSETSTRSSSTPSIPQSLAEHGLEPFDDADALPHFSSPIWVDRVAMNLRPMSFHKDSAQEQCNSTSPNVPGDNACNDQSPQEASKPPDGAGSFKKKRSKSADVWRDDSLEVSLSDASLERLTSTEDLTDNANNADVTRANSLGELYTSQVYAKKRHKSGSLCRDGEEDKMLSPCDDDGATYGAFTLPCRRSHCLSEGLTGHQAAMPGRRAQTIQDVTIGDVTDLEDSGIDGLIGDGDVCEFQSRHFKALSVYSTPAGGGGDTPDSGVQGVYENFRQELEKSSCRADTLEERASALSDELSSANQTEALAGAAEGCVRKAGRLNVKNLLVHKKNKKVELAARRKWKSYWVLLKGCTLFFYETDGRSGIDHTSIPKHAVWAENSIAQAVPEHPKKDFVFCLSNSMGDSFLFQTCSQTEVENWVTAIHSACAAAVARQHHRDDTVRFLRSEIRKLEQKIDMDEKMKKMGDMQLASVTDTKKRKTILEQVFAEGEEPMKRDLEGMMEESSRTSVKDEQVCVTGLVKDRLTPSWVCLPDGRPILAVIRPGESALDALETICKAHNLDSTKHYLRLKFLIETQVQFYIPKPEEDVYDLLYKEIELCSKIRKVIQFDRDESCMIGYGFSISMVEDDSVQQLYITDVKAGGLAFAKGLNAGDEILQLNGKNSSTLMFSDMKTAFSQASLSLTVNTLPPMDRRQHCFLPPRRSDAVQQLYTDIFSQNQEDILDDGVGLISDASGDSPDDDTELFSDYEKLDVLFGNLPEMLEFQVEFLRTLEDGTRLVPDLEKLERVDQFKKVLFSLGGSFLYYADRFKIYSAFCASHTKVPKVLVKAKSDPDFKAFLDERNPKQQHSSTLESYLIKPIQRVLNEDKDPFRFRHMISTDALQVRTLTGAESVAIAVSGMVCLHFTDGDSAAVCEIVHVKSESEGRPERVFHLCCSSPESKKDFLKMVHSILRDKQRRQLMKTESLPPSQQYVPFGGKRLCALKGARPAMSRAASAPTRTLGRRKLVRNRFTIDTDIVFDTDAEADSPDSQTSLQPGDTDRWVEEQFDLQRYEEQEQAKETDLLSDEDVEGDDEDLSQEVEGPVSAMSLEDEEEETKTESIDNKPQHALRLSDLGKQCAMSVASVDEQSVVANENVWVRREMSSTDSETQNESQS